MLGTHWRTSIAPGGDRETRMTLMMVAVRPVPPPPSPLPSTQMIGPAAAEGRPAIMCLVQNEPHLIVCLDVRIQPLRAPLADGAHHGLPHEAAPQAPAPKVVPHHHVQQVAASLVVFWHTLRRQGASGTRLLLLVVRACGGQG
jgi:hypothetical protein